MTNKPEIKVLYAKQDEASLTIEELHRLVKGEWKKIEANEDWLMEIYNKIEVDLRQATDDEMGLVWRDNGDFTAEVQGISSNEVPNLNEVKTVIKEYLAFYGEMATSFIFVLSA